MTLLQRSDHQVEMVLDLTDLVDPQDITCPDCGLDGDTQEPIRVGRDGAFERIDYSCGGCRAQHPIWIG